VYYTRLTDVGVLHLYAMNSDAPKKAAFSLLRLCITGFHFCDRCDRILDFKDDEAEKHRCPHCKHFTVIWCAPILGDEGPITQPHPQHETIAPVPAVAAGR
jgi:hypothetical protein